MSFFFPAHPSVTCFGELGGGMHVLSTLGLSQFSHAPASAGRLTVIHEHFLRN